MVAKRALLLEASKLTLYVKSLRQSLITLQHAPLWDRNPYIRSANAKQHLKALQEDIAQCVDSLLCFGAMLEKAHVCDSKELHAYFFVYEFLFAFKDDILKQEYAHRLFIRDVELTTKFYKFFDYSKLFIEKQEARINALQS